MFADFRSTNGIAAATCKALEVSSSVVLDSVVAAKWGVSQGSVLAGYAVNSLHQAASSPVLSTTSSEKAKAKKHDMQQNTIFKFLEYSSAYQVVDHYIFAINLSADPAHCRFCSAERENVFWATRHDAKALSLAIYGSIFSEV